jgi:predicted TIM-barrel fold metal-dependent hydrolase
MPPFTQDVAPPCQPPLTNLVSPKTRLPANACDTHLHILGPATTYPYSPDRVYTPPDCLLADYVALRESLGLSRCVLVQPSVYGADNAALLRALEGLGDRGRGVVVLGTSETNSQLRDMNAVGVRGVRVNLVDVKTPGSKLPMDALRHLEDRIAPRGWHLELLVHVDQHPNLDEELGGLEVPIVFGHMGYLSRGLSPDHPGMRAMLALMQAGRAWSKITGPYRIDTGPEYPKAKSIADWLVAKCPGKLLWGSDWPHVVVKGAMPHDADLLDLAAGWIAEEARQAIFADNPAELYGWN